jgi:hypothetical protein
VAQFSRDGHRILWGGRVERRRIGVLWHERDRRRDLGMYAITHLAEHWRSDGHDVRFIFGTGRFEAADLVIVHVDLSIVPAGYLDFAARFPIALNGRVQDIRRTGFSRILVRPGDGYAGPVIVKSNQNHAGAPDRARAAVGLSGIRWRLRRRLAAIRGSAEGEPPLFGTPLDYRIFDCAVDVPSSWFSRPDIVIERFVPERDGQDYVVRNYQFLGDRSTWTRVVGPQPIVNAYTQVRVEPCDPDAEIERRRYELGFDYGKFDYVMHEGQAVLLDTNKTTGAASIATPEVLAARRHRADGLYSFFNQPAGV